MFRRRCHILLLISRERTPQDIADILSISMPTVYHWYNLYVAEGIEGLRTKQGRGRPRIFQDSDIHSFYSPLHYSRTPATETSQKTD